MTLPPLYGPGTPARRFTRNGASLILPALIVVALISAAAVWTDAAAQAVDAGILPGADRLTASPTTDAIDLDGFLDEAVWQEAEAISDFTQFEPLEGQPATQRTTVRVLYGANSLYVGAVLDDEEATAIEAALGRRDEYNRADWFLVSIDSYFDKKTAYTFGVNAAGVQLDAIQTSGRRSNNNGPAPGGDTSWDAIWYASHRVSPEGWVVEMRIPYSMLRFPEAADQTWGIHFTRSIPRLGEQAEWPYIPRVERTNLVARFGHLTGLRDVRPKRNLQVRPYASSQLQRSEDPDEAGRVIGAHAMDVGGDLKIGIGSNVTFDLTLNPDFGQVESDPSVLNLTAFETVFQERRPFFLEGTQIFDFDAGPAQLPYTRRIGAHAPIIGAAKLSGRTERGLSFGVLGAATGTDFDPSRFYGVARVTREFGTYSRIGGIVTGFDGPSAGSGAGDSRSLFAGVDYDVRFGDNMFNVEGFVGVTDRRSGLGDDQGFGAKFLLRKRRGALTGFTGVEGFDRRFYVNDIALLRQNDYVALPLRLAYEINGGQPFGPFLRASVGDFGMQQFSLSNGLDLGQRHSFSAEGTLRGFQQVELGVTFENLFGGYDIYETRGLHPWKKPFIVSVEGAFASDQRRTWQVGPAVSASVTDLGGQTFGVGGEGRWKVGPRLALSGQVDGLWENDVVAWASNETFMEGPGGWLMAVDAGRPDAEPADFVAFDDRGQLDAALAGVSPNTGTGYFMPIFGARDTRSIDLTLRGTVTFTPGLSIQVYSQLFLARGRYAQFQILRDRDHLAPFDAFPKRNEFTFSTLQSNAVLRWEYRPGSTLYLVWTHGRRADDALNPLAPGPRSPYDRSINGQISDTFDRIPTNVFLIKISYTFL